MGHWKYYSNFSRSRDLGIDEMEKAIIKYAAEHLRNELNYKHEIKTIADIQKAVSYFYEMINIEEDKSHYIEGEMEKPFNCLAGPGTAGDMILLCLRKGVSNLKYEREREKNMLEAIRKTRGITQEDVHRQQIDALIQSNKELSEALAKNKAAPAAVQAGAATPEAESKIMQEQEQNKPEINKLMEDLKIERPDIYEAINRGLGKNIFEHEKLTADNKPYLNFKIPMNCIGHLFSGYENNEIIRNNVKFYDNPINIESLKTDKSTYKYSKPPKWGDVNRVLKFINPN
jgi:ribosomal protein L12E/L44/L45/RPP1/RPP2